MFVNIRSQDEQFYIENSVLYIYIYIQVFIPRILLHIEGCILISSEDKLNLAQAFATIILLHLQEMHGKIFKIS